MRERVQALAEEHPLVYERAAASAIVLAARPDVEELINDALQARRDMRDALGPQRVRCQQAMNVGVTNGGVVRLSGLPTEPLLLVAP